MITFKQYLEESRSAPLYHACHLTAALNIAHDGGVRGATLHPSWKLLKNEYKNGVSTTRSFRFAKDWGIYRAARHQGSYVIFEFDQQKVTHRFQIKPVQYFQSKLKDKNAASARMHDPRQNEDEEFIILKGTGDIAPITLVNRIYYFINPETVNTRAEQPIAKILEFELKKLRSIAEKYPNIKFKPLPGSKIA